MSKHTATPWVAEPDGGKGSWIKGPTGEWAAMSCGDTHASASTNAAFIVRAVNAHDQLVAALNEAHLQIEYLHGKFTATGSGNAVLDRINTVLASVEQSP